MQGQPRCNRCRSLGHWEQQCRARCDIFTKEPLPAPDVPQVYVLECLNQKYYVGMSTDPGRRFQQHKQGEGCAWTRQHPPVNILNTITDRKLYSINPHACQEQDEFYACVYNYGGVDNVRGWLYTDPELSSYDRQSIIKQVSAHFNLCYVCGFKSHISGECYADRQANWRTGTVFYEINKEFHD